MTYRVQRINRHPGYRSWRCDYNIALLQLSSSVQLSNSANTAQLANDGDTLPDDTICILYGWNVGNLSAVELLKKNQTECQNHYGGLLTVTDNMVCASDDDQMKGGCIQDLGAPLVCNDKLFGVLTYFNCGLSLFSNVFAYVPPVRSWIEQVVGTPPSLITTTAVP